MANDIASMYPQMNRDELIYANFIKSRIERNGGSLKFQHITGQLSQLDQQARLSVGASPRELMVFFKKYDGIFEVDDGIVSLTNPSINKGTPVTPESDMKDKSEKESAFPKVINNVLGVVIKVQPTFGFIAIKEPVRTSVYFTPSCFNEESKTLLTDLGIVPGKKVCLNARIGNLEFESKYRATKVWIPKNVENEVLHPEGFHPKIPKKRETGLYDADTTEGNGTVQKIFDTYGFIIIDGDQNNTVFFHKNRVCNVENVNDLSKIFRPGDLVDFKAVRSTKPQQQRVRWEATKVWLRKKSKAKSTENAESATSDYGSISSQSKKSKSAKGSDPLGKNQKKNKNKNDLEPKEISNESGKIYPSSKGIVIRFGEKDSKLADADSCLFYLHKVKVEDVSWEFSDGDVVKFDGVKIKSPPGFKALLAWVGDKPDVVPITIGDFSEQSDEDIEYLSENESLISKASSISALSENNLGLSETKRQNVYSSVSSLVSSSSKKSRRNRSRSRGNELKKHSNFNEGKSHPISSNLSKHSRNRSRSRGYELKNYPDYYEDVSPSVSRNSSKHSRNRSRSRGHELKKYPDYYEDVSYSVSRNSSKHSGNRSRSKGYENKSYSNYKEDDSHSVSSNSGKKLHNRSNLRVDENKKPSNFHEDDSHSISSNSRSSQGSGFSGERRRRSKSRNSNFKKNYKSNSVNSSHSQLANCRSKASSMESVNSLSSDIKNKLKPNPDLYKNWGDTPYPDDDDNNVEIDKVHFKAHGRDGIQRENKFSNGDTSSGKSSPCSDEMDKQIENITNDFVSKTNLNTSDKAPNSSDKMASAISSRYAEIFLSDADDSDALEEVNDENTSINDDNDVNDGENTQTQVEEKPNSYIKRFQDLVGHVKKVFCRYAEIENDKLKKPGTFFWHDMYHNGTPVADKFDDLKEVLSSGQTVKFNCFEIVDDAGTSFVKITVAWKGSKPKITEMTPDEFIAQNGISFSGTEISTIEDVVESAFSESMRPLNDESVASAAPVAPPRKFLTVAGMSEDDSEEENNPNAPAESRVIPMKEDSDSNSLEYVDLREDVLSNSENMDISQLTDAISKMLESLKNSEMDSNVVASDIVNIILSTVRAGGNQSVQENSVPSVESIETNRRPIMTDSYAQTIITGKIFSESSLLDSLKHLM